MDVVCFMKKLHLFFFFVRFFFGGCLHFDKICFMLKNLALSVSQCLLNIIGKWLARRIPARRK